MTITVDIILELIHEKRVKCAVYVSLIPCPVVCKLIQVADQTDF